MTIARFLSTVIPKYLAEAILVNGSSLVKKQLERCVDQDKNKHSQDFDKFGFKPEGREKL